jgi:outer membrane lipoprotein-sorting protein
MAKASQSPFRIAGALLVVAAFFACRPAQEQPTAASLLNGVQSTYRGMKTFSSKATLVTEMDGPEMQQKQEMRVKIIAVASGKYRMGSTGATGMLVINDGQNIWVYMPQNKKFQKFSLNIPGSQHRSMANPGITIPVGFAGVVSYGTVATNVKRARVLGSRTLRIGGSKVQCWVVSVDYKPHANQRTSRKSSKPMAVGSRTSTLWVEKTHHLVYRDDLSISAAQTGAATPIIVKASIKFGPITTDQPVQESMFTFAPPPGATEMNLPGLMSGIHPRR